jgi:hypothetical protein
VVPEKIYINPKFFRSFFIDLFFIKLGKRLDDNKSILLNKRNKSKMFSIMFNDPVEIFTLPILKGENKRIPKYNIENKPIPKLKLTLNNFIKLYVNINLR